MYTFRTSQISKSPSEVRDPNMENRPANNIILVGAFSKIKHSEPTRVITCSHCFTYVLFYI